MEGRRSKPHEHVEAGGPSVIAAIGLDAAALESLRDELEGAGRRAAVRTADVSDAPGLEAAVGDLARALGPFHVVHANAGILAPPTTITELDLDEWNRVLAVNLTGVVLTFRAAIPHLVPDGGVLLATGSSTAVRPGVGMLPYVAAKAGVHAIARSLGLREVDRRVAMEVVAEFLLDGFGNPAAVPQLFEIGWFDLTWHYPTFSSLGRPAHLRNALPDSGAEQASLHCRGARP